MSDILRLKVAAVSANTNAFGLKSHVLVARDGRVFKALRTRQYSCLIGETVNIKVVNKRIDWAAEAWECPEALQNAPFEVVENLWGKEALRPGPVDENARRVAAAEEALRTNPEFETTGPRSALVDLLTNLRHWASKVGVDFEDIVRISRSHFKAEQEEAAHTD